MKSVIQRVHAAEVLVDGKVISKIGKGILMLVGIEDTDSISDIQWLSLKVIQMRIFNDRKGKMNLSLKDVEGDILLVSQFTLCAATKKGNRPSFIKAAKPQKAMPIYKQLIGQLQDDAGKDIKTGVFGADMKVSLVNEGPVTIIIDSKNKE